MPSGCGPICAANSSGLLEPNEGVMLNSTLMMTRYDLGRLQTRMQSLMGSASDHETRRGADCRMLPNYRRLGIKA